ncbi:MAG: hypothetical protein B7Y36_02405 [Novosphingobium sp. 28-62-57]|uniref:hypothetical protein n=1 Tax=unclassified Novosphingobium TaxID=2644732 RepID=UPI000BD11317|nr:MULTISPECIES: hypothetical protein [unclassified Novosphingobium]OYW49646.1 MAG: hypothetical protein B7Z34_08205 [Novosphingobium sp. 12-62-10]OYZ12397.1 MAG: hypothetical protein B7Y36_02405 [Novosphingobium sp. 28-62-57]OZA36054.1 MAG: hypothetical protein B7X92_07945 [Novosphingobium sp. 17-62-9]HQS69585.1 hypothetical protein [Novosphingobium sp.]
MTAILKIVGIAALLVGGLWAGQGLGLIMWPASSFMLAQPRWAYIGAGLMVLGALALWRAGKQR